MNTTPILPDDADDLAQVMAEHIWMEEARQSGRFLRWQLAHAYMNGQRRFEFINGSTQYGYMLDKEGRVPLTVPEMLNNVNKTTGLISAMDLWPDVIRRGDSMGTVRDSAVMQVILDSITNDDHLRIVVEEAAYLVSLLGTCGLSAEVVEHPSLGLIADLEVVHPCELFSFPSIGFDGTKIRGLVRCRKVPIERLKAQYGTKITANLDKMHTARRKVAQAPEYLGNQENSTYHEGASYLQKGGKDDTTYVEAKVWEVWIDGPQGTCSRYATGSGKYVIYDSNKALEGVAYYCPISIARFWKTGDFYGAGLFDSLYTLSREMEAMVKSLVTNVKDLDRYPPVLIPPGALDESLALRDTGYPLRFIKLKAEASILGMSDFKPTVLPLHNAGETPGRTSAFLQGLIGSHVPIRDIIKEKGRVDSYAGLQYLEEEGSRSNVVPVANVSRAFGAAYRSLGHQALAKLVRKSVKMPVKRLDVALAGAVIDFDDSTFTLGKNRVPDISRLSFRVKEESPKSKSIRKQEATAFLEKQMVTLTQYKLLAIKEGWDPAMWLDGEIAAYNTVTMNILSIYGDGEEPGPAVWVTANTERPDLQLEILNAFMQSPTMRIASADVVNEFVKYRTALLAFQGKMLPELVPDPYPPALTPEQGAGNMSGPQMAPQQQQA